MDEERFVIMDDKTADWALDQIKAAEDERDRLIALANEKINELTERIKELNEKCERDTAYLKGCLFEFFGTVPHKETKTQSTYKLLSGSLVFKKESTKIEHNDDALIKYLEENDGAEYIKIKKSVDWAEFKKNLTVSDSGEVIDSELGTIIPTDACTIVDVPATFNVKF